MATTNYGPRTPAAQGARGYEGPRTLGSAVSTTPKTPYTGEMDYEYGAGSSASGSGTSQAKASIDPNSAYSQITSRFRTKFNRDISPEEQQALYRQPGVNYTPGSTVTQSMLDAAFGYIDRYTGNLANPWGPAATTPSGPTSPLSTKVPGWTPYSPGTPPPSATYTPGQLPQTPLPTYNPMQLPTQGLPGYTQSQYTQFLGPDQAGAGDAQNALLMKVLANPESLDPQTVSMLQERQKENALRYETDLRGQMQQSAASRGTLGGGAQLAGERRLGQDTSQSILGSNRDISIAAAQTNMEDRRRAIQAATDVMNARSGRATSEYGATLAGQSAQAGENQFAWNTGAEAAKFGLTQAQAQAAENLIGHQSQVAAVNAAMQGALEQEGLNQAGATSALGAWQAGTEANLGSANQNLQRYLGELGIELDQNKLTEAANQFKQQYGLDLMRILDDMVMGRANYGAQLAQIGMSQQQFMANWLQGIGSGN